MKNMVLLIVDTAQIQPYIFGSNRLRENIGASYLVAQATGRWAFEKVDQATQGRCNFESGRQRLIEDWHIDNRLNQEACAEVVYAGGGNFVVLFSQLNAAIEFTRLLSRVVLERAPGLQLVIASKAFDWDAGGMALKQAMAATFKKLNTAKRARLQSAPLLGLGVTVMCQSTSLPATGITPPITDQDGEIDPSSMYPASADILAKIAVAETANRFLRDTFREALNDADNIYDFPRDFDELGRTRHEDSHVALLHADGNGMGKCIQEMSDLGASNRAYIHNLRRFSDLVRLVAHDSMSDVVKQVRQRVDPVAHCIVHNAAGHELSRINLPSKWIEHERRWLLPMRPIVFGGDDLTLVCDGRIGLSVAIEYLQEFEANAVVRMREVFADPADREIVELLRKPGNFTACAGVAIVKTHFPFSRAYDLAESLCDSAKKERAVSGIPGSCLDWHLALSGVTADLAEIRKREYTVKDGLLNLRPMTVGDNPIASYRAWGAVEEAITRFQSDRLWALRHNKVKALRTALRDGSEAVRRFIDKYNEGKPLPSLNAGMVRWPTHGWQDRRCGYFDAIELVDMHMPLIISESATHETQATAAKETEA